MQPVLKAESVTKKVSSPEGTLTILAEVDLQIAAGETVSIVGASGAGKSTLLALLAGLDEPSAGRVWLNGAELTALDEDGRAAVRARHVGFVFQSFHLVPSLTAIENVMLPLELAGLPNARTAAAEVLAQVNLSPRREHYPRQLSGGEQQRVAIARAFVTRPALLFADEPTSGRVWLNGSELTALNEDGRAAVRARHVGFVFQSFHLVPSLTAIENVMLPLELAGLPNARTAAAEVLAQVNLSPRREHYPRQLSGGEQQRVAIARAFVTRPALLFADEPTGNLDSVTGERIIELLFDLNKATQTTLVVVTHDQAIASRCGRIIRIEAGRLVS